MPAPSTSSRRRSRRAGVRWAVHPEWSATWAAYVVATGAPCIDPKTESLLIGPIADINDRLLSASIDVGSFWKHYAASRLNDGELEEATALALLAAGCGEMQLEQTVKIIKNRLIDARSAFQGRYPKLAEQLELRGRPLRERWDTYGEGLLREVERQIWNNSPPSDWWPTRTSGWLVQPLVGGSGDSDEANERFWIEAMLTDADPLVPEVVRVAWLVTRIAIGNHNRQRSGETSLMVPWQLASVPLVLSAAAEVELVRGDTLPIARAMELWKFGDPAVAERLTLWWNEFVSTKTPLPVALKKLAV
ncbi:hypothetical protein Poly51_57640 [Rubripirellula tenax]|uniref:Uncharacterized protein n=1 Tax=Rubripirellula tenax TaxID=2528015 RepID=A0A5C6EBU9_9BACT|nr:hypothetical protein [Rubripirellula tenax]TWU46368.1 hypothetical protein Poly51_57640 [Rubripirellula tenax]